MLWSMSLVRMWLICTTVLQKERQCVQTQLLATEVSTDIWRSSIFRGLTWIRVWPPCTWIITRINEVYKVCVLVNLIYGHHKGWNSSLWGSKWFSKEKIQSPVLSWSLQFNGRVSFITLTVAAVFQGGMTWKRSCLTFSCEVLSLFFRYSHLCFKCYLWKRFYLELKLEFYHLHVFLFALPVSSSGSCHEYKHGCLRFGCGQIPSKGKVVLIVTQIT